MGSGHWYRSYESYIAWLYRIARKYVKRACPARLISRPFIVRSHFSSTVRQDVSGWSKLDNASQRVSHRFFKTSVLYLLLHRTILMHTGTISVLFFFSIHTHCLALLPYRTVPYRTVPVFKIEIGQRSSTKLVRVKSYSSMEVKIR